MDQENNAIKLGMYFELNDISEFVTCTYFVPRGKFSL